MMKSKQIFVLKTFFLIRSNSLFNELIFAYNNMKLYQEAYHLVKNLNSEKKSQILKVFFKFPIFESTFN